MKMPVEWHLSNLCNRQRGMERMQVKVRRAQMELEFAIHDYDKSRAQIIRATNEGKDSFDPERYMV